MHRRTFVKHGSTVLAGSLISNQILQAASSPNKKTRVAMVGTGHRGTGMWGSEVIKEFKETVEFVGLADMNPGRLETAKQMMKLECPTFVDFDKMIKETKPEILIVTTVDNTHDEFIIKGMEYGADIVTEKPMTTDEDKCERIINAEKRTGKKVKVTFNYRYSPHRQKIWELLNAGEIGDITSVDFHWYLDTQHGADYFRRWHRLKKNSGSLLVHKASHHFDLLNWWIGSDPKEVYANGALEHYGKNNPFRHTHCRPCPHKKECKFYWDVTKDPRLVKLYVDNEKHDGYVRDGCVWKEDIDIFDKMAVQIKYMNDVQVSYSLTAYSPYEGYRISFNGKLGKIDAWIKERQPWEEEPYDIIELTKNFGKKQSFKLLNNEPGHGGGDIRLRKQIFKPDGTDPFKQAANSRDGAMAILIGIAARKSIEKGKVIEIKNLTTLVPQKVKQSV